MSTCILVFQKGSLQAYNLGKNLRMRYYRLLPPNGLYTQQQVRVLSSAAERCLMSANSLLAGFMPPLEHNNPLPIEWQTVAVNSIPRNEDTVGIVIGFLLQKQYIFM